MNILIGKNEHFPKRIINREKELKLINTAINSLLSKNLLTTPIIDFFGIDGIGKTRILQEIAEICRAKDLPCIRLDEKQTSQNTSNISRAIVQQTKKYRPKTFPTKQSNTQVVEAIKILLESTPVVILLDAIDTSNETLVNWIKTTLHALIEHNNLFVVLTSKQKIVFENDWFMTRKLTPLQLKPLTPNDSAFYLQSLNNTIPLPEKVIFQWTRGYPSAMEVMTKALVERRFDLAKSEDQKQLVTILLKEIIDKKVLTHVEPAQLDWYKAHCLLLSIPRRFNIIIMQELLEKFGSAPIEKTQSKLAYMGLPKQLNAATDILHWDLEKAGYTIDETIRNIFFVYQQVYHPSLFTEMHKYLADRNKQLATEVAGSDSVRYLREYLYHSTQSDDAQTAEAMLQYLQQWFNTMPSDVQLQFSEEFRQDNELKEILEQHYGNVYTYIQEHVATEE